MANIVVCGGSVIGLTAAMLLARDGHDVTVLERDPAEVPSSWEEAWDTWDRPGVPQFHQPHNLFPRYRKILDEELPDVLDGLVANGGTWVNFVGQPAAVHHRPRAAARRRPAPLRDRSPPDGRVRARPRRRERAARDRAARRQGARLRHRAER